jgi:LPXTG-site transpeptidase (sortase) family protein
MLGNLLMLSGFVLLLYVGGIYAQIEYHRYAARGDTSLPAPRILTSDPVGQVSGSNGDTPAAFTVPVLDGTDATAGQIVSAPPTDTAPASTIERIMIPSLDVDSKVIEVGWDVVEQNGQQVAVWQVAEYAVGHHTGSANPGEGENVVLAGHVGGYGKVFRDLFSIEPGDHVIVYSAGQQYLYVVQERLVLEELGVPLEQRQANGRYIQPGGTEVVTLVTCWPPEGPDVFSQRIVVRAEPYGTQQAAPAEQPAADNAETQAAPGTQVWTVR